MSEKRLLGTWRSYKTFCHLGEVKKNGTDNFIELRIEDSGMLTFKPYPTASKALWIQTERWELTEINRTWELYIQDKKWYEVITLEPEDLVVFEPNKGEKIFLAKLESWNKRLHPKKTVSEDTMI